MSNWQQSPFYIFFIIRPDGNSAYCKIHQQYPLNIQIDKLLGLISLVSAVNNLQTGIVHPQVVSSRSSDDIDLISKPNIKSINTTTFQIRILDNVSGYRFAIMSGNHVKTQILDDKLQQIYKCFVNYVIKAPFFNVRFYYYKKLEITKNPINKLLEKKQLDTLQLIKRFFIFFDILLVELRKYVYCRLVKQFQVDPFLVSRLFTLLSQSIKHTFLFLFYLNLKESTKKRLQNQKKWKKSQC